MTLPDGRGAIVTLVNISADGVLARHEHRLEEGDMVQLSMPVIGKVSGRAVWSIGGRTGVQFTSRIPDRDYAPLLRAFGVKSPA